MSDHDNVTRLRFPRHEHDHLCPIKHEEHITRENCTFCTLIDAARADEREQAAQRVTALCAHTKYVGCQPCIHDECAEAARGEA